MALTDILSHLWVPAVPPWIQSTNFSFGNFALAAATNKCATIFRVPKTGNIAKIGFRSSTVTSSGDADIRLETVTSGAPSGTLFGTNANATQTISASNTWHLTTLTAACAVTVGNEIAAVIVNSTGNYQISGLTGTNFPLNMPFGLLNTGSWVNNAARPGIAIEYDDGTYGYIPGVSPYSAINTTTYHNTTVIGSGGSERGNKITTEWGGRSWGFWAYIDPDANADVKLYDSSFNQFSGASVAVTSLGRFSTNSGLFVCPWPTKPTITANSPVYLTLSPSSGTTVSLIDAQVNTTAIFAGALEGGSSIFLVSRAGGSGSFTETATTRRAYMGLIFDQIDIGGGGGVVFNPGLTGGMAG